jgi:hypothetical protein
MSELNLFKVRAKVVSVNGRQELHGEEHRLACDIGIEVNQPNRVLDKLDTRLLETFYWKNPAGAQQEDLDGVERVTDYPNLRFEHLGMPVKWLEKFEDCLFVLHHGDDDSLDLKLVEAKVNEIRITPKEGGTTTLGMRIQAHPDEGDLARLFTVLQSEVTVTVDTDPDDEEPDAAPAPAAKKTARKKKGAQQEFDDERVSQIKDAMTSVVQ